VDNDATGAIPNPGAIAAAAAAAAAAPPGGTGANAAPNGAPPIR
jgi:hypothetical protein